MKIFKNENVKEVRNKTQTSQLENAYSLPIFTEKQRMRNRECPYCHKEISLKRCFLYIYRGTNYPTRCNHCSHKVMLVREPVPFMYCVCAGFLSIYIPTSLFLYFYHFSFWKAALCSLPFALICFIVCVVLTFKRLFFKRTD